MARLRSPLARDRGARFSASDPTARDEQLRARRCLLTRKPNAPRSPRLERFDAKGGLRSATQIGEAGWIPSGSAVDSKGVVVAAGLIDSFAVPPLGSGGFLVKMAP